MLSDYHEIKFQTKTQVKFHIKTNVMMLINLKRFAPKLEI